MKVQRLERTCGMCKSFAPDTGVMGHSIHGHEMGKRSIDCLRFHTKLSGGRETPACGEFILDQHADAFLDAAKAAKLIMQKGDVEKEKQLVRFSR